MSDTNAPNEDLHDGPQDSATRIQALEGEVAEALHKYKCALAEHQNFARRAVQNEVQARQFGAASVVESLFPVLDNFEIALSMNPSGASAESILGGVRLVRDEMIKALSLHGVGEINPKAGEAFTPGRHEAVMHQRSDSVEPGCVVMTLQKGYTLGERVIRPAKVSVAPAD